MTAITQVKETDIISVEYFSDTTIAAFVASRHGSANSCKTYRNATRRLVKYFADNGVAQPKAADFDAYINTLRANGKSASTLRLYSTVGKMFFGYLEKHGIYSNITSDAAPLKLRKSSTHNKKALTDKQAKMLLSAVKGDNEIALRDRCIIALALQTGLRTCEIERADVGDLEDAGDYYTLAVRGKGRLAKDEILKVALPVAKLILSYLNLRGVTDKNAPLFTSKSRNVSWAKNSYGVRLSAQSIGKLIKSYMKIAGINDSKITAHSTRHFAATTAIKAGVDIREVSAMLRHTSVVITSTYLHDISLETRRAELAVADSLFGAA